MIEFAFTKTLHGSAGSFRLDTESVFDAGSFVTLFGSSGAGKTTILRMLAGLAQPDSGRIVIEGQTWFDSQKRINLPPRKRAVGFVFQDYALFPNLSVRDNVAYAANKGNTDWVEELIVLTGLTSLQLRKPDSLSGGQKQRVALARALARKPALLLLDEPLSALDAGLRTQLQDDIAGLHQRLGFTAILVSHDMGEVFKLSQQVLVLEQGVIARRGTPAEVFLHKTVAGRFNTRAQVLTVRHEEVVYVVSLAIGQDIVDVIASEDEVAGLKPGDAVSVSAKAFSPQLMPVHATNAPLKSSGA